MLKACALSLQEFPELNARLEGDEIVYLDRYDLGVAVQTEQGLVVPVVRGCDTRSVDELAADVRRLAEAARAGKLTPEELRGSTFTVTSAGKLGGLLTTPIVNYPEVAILERRPDRPRPCRARRRGRRSAGRALAITFDHRVIDGARAAEFGLAVIRRLEDGLSRSSPGARSGQASQVRVEYPLDLAGADATLLTLDHALVLDQEQRFHRASMCSRRTRSGCRSTSMCWTRSRLLPSGARA